LLAAYIIYNYEALLLKRMDKLKIGIVCYPTYGGSGVVATELGKALAKKGHSIHFISYAQPPRLSHFHKNITFHEVGLSDYPLFEYPPYESALASKLVDTVRFSNLDLIHVHYAIPHATSAFLAKSILKSSGIEIPIVTTLHGTDITLVGKDATMAPVVTFSINQSDGVTAVSESLKQDTYKNFDVKNEIEVIPNFIDLEAFQKLEKGHFKQAIAPNGEPIIIHVSNFRKVKRVQDVVRSFDLIRKEVPAKLFLIGDGPERKMAEALCREIGNCEDIRFLGKQDAIGELLAVGDLFMLPSESESFGLAALEAMACEVPVISSNAGGIPEINIDGITGFLSEVGDVESMAKNALQLLQNENKLNEFRKNALAQAQRFDINEIMPLYESFYQKVISSVAVLN